MAGNTKVLRARIKSVTSTLQLTKAMELVASSKIRRANEAMARSRQYREALGLAIDSLTRDKEVEKSPYMRQSDGERTRIIVIAGDRGLAGGYNANVFRAAGVFKGAEFIPIGKRACDKYSKPFISSEYFSFEDSMRLADKLCADFADGKYDRLGIISTRYVNVMSQEAYITWLLPLQKGEDKSNSVTVFEPDGVTVLNNAIREYVAGMITVLVRESFASEIAARRIAMDSAGKNARQMISDLQLEYNRARQGAITQEITEIVAGSGNG